MKITDGTGSGVSAAVRSDNSLRVFATSVAEDRVVAEESGKVWSYSFEDIDPTGADDYFFYFKNTTTDFTYLLSDIRIVSTVAGALRVRGVSGTASSGTTVSPISRQVGSVAVPGATCETDVDITGLTDNGTIFYMYLAANNYVQLSTTSRIHVPPGQAIALNWGAGTGVLSGTVSIYERTEGGEI